MSDVRRRVVKLGGSSMSTDYAALLRRWLAAQTPVETIVVMGGGREISRVARDQQREEFDDAEAHWLCIEVMRQNAQKLIQQVPEAKWLPCCSELSQAGESTTLWIVDPWRFMLDDAKTKMPLPESWDVSSDSIAARLAERVAADELVLLKSRLPPDLRRLGRYVDPLFTFAARNAPRVRFVNVSDPKFAEVRWSGAKSSFGNSNVRG